MRAKTGDVVLIDENLVYKIMNHVEMAIEALEAQEPREMSDAELMDAIRKAPIMITPAVDAAPVVHARWKDNGNETVSCSRCATWFQKEREPYLRYCGWCGAKMDKED